MDPKVLARYNSVEGADSYRAEYETKLHRKLSHKLEQRLFQKLFARAGKVGSLVDIPCGRGRLREIFLENAERVVEGDWSYHMLEGNRRDYGGDGRTPYFRASAIHLPLADRSFDCVASIRLNHHIDDVGERERHLQELLRVADRYVIFTFFSYHSLKNLWRRARRPFNKKRPKRTLSMGRVRELAKEQGFQLVMAPTLSKLGSGHRFALLERIEAS